jgi:hypothetical protein
MQFAKRDPVDPATLRPGTVCRLDRRLVLITARTTDAVGAAQQRLAALDHRGIPQPGVLLVQRHELPVAGAPRRPTRFGQAHQRRQAERLGLVWQPFG